MFPKKRKPSRKHSKEALQKLHKLQELPKEMRLTNNTIAIVIIIFISMSLVSFLSSPISDTAPQPHAPAMTGKLVTDANVHLCINKEPVINQSCNTTATIGIGYYCDVNASDPDNNTITFYDNTGLFNIDPNTGEIIFTPATTDAGSYNIVITASDGQRCSNSNITTSFNLTIPSLLVPPQGTGGVGIIELKCIPQWQCTPWSECSLNMKKTRTCKPLNVCLEDKPAEVKDCIYVLPPKPWTPRYPQFDFCNFDEEESCLRNVGIREDWLMTYKGDVGVLNFMNIDDSGIDVSIDDEILFHVGMKKIMPVDIDGDGVADVEFIYHSKSGVRADVTGNLLKQREVVLEHPVYIEKLPWWLVAILIFAYENACIILLLVIILIAVLIYSEMMEKFDQKIEQKEKESTKKRL